jgi:hypothetical protein
MHCRSRAKRRLRSCHQRKRMLQQVSVEHADIDMYRRGQQRGEAEEGKRIQRLNDQGTCGADHGWYMIGVRLLQLCWKSHV